MSSLIKNEFNYDIVITCYNSDATIGRAITSALNQIIIPKNIIIVDDNSQDGSIEIINDLKTSNSIIKVLFNDINMGQSYCRNQGVNLSTSEYVMFLDDDDFSLPERSIMHSNMFQEGAQISFVSSIKNYANGYSVACKNTDVNNRKFHATEMLDYLITGTGQNFPYKVYIPASTCAVNVECYKGLGGFDTSLRRLEDVDFAIRVAKEEFCFSWTSEIGVNRFFSHRIDKGRGIDSKYEIMILNKFQGLIENVKFNDIVLYAKLREIYFGKHYLMGFFFVMTHPSSVKIIRKKVLVLISRVIHDFRKLG